MTVTAPQTITANLRQNHRKLTRPRRAVLDVVPLSSIRSYTTDLGAILFGNVLAVSNQDMMLTLLLGMAVVAILYLTYKELLLVSFDRTMAAALGLPIAWLDQLLLLLLTVTIIISLQAVGNILVLAMLIIPTATARLFVERFQPLMLLSAIIGALCGVMGLYASYYLNLASGGTIVLLATLVFIISFVFSPAMACLPVHSSAVVCSQTQWLTNTTA